MSIFDSKQTRVSFEPIQRNVKVVRIVAHSGHISSISMAHGRTIDQDSSTHAYSRWGKYSEKDVQDVERTSARRKTATCGNIYTSLANRIIKLRTESQDNGT